MTLTAAGSPPDLDDPDQVGAVLDQAIRARTRRRLMQAGLLPLGALVVIAVVGILTAAGAPRSPGRAHPTATPPVASVSGSTTPGSTPGSTTPAVPTVSFGPTSVAVVVDAAHPLPPGYVPPDLVAPLVHFTFAGTDEKRLMRREAAEALVPLFSAAAQAGVPLLGVSAYRSEARQRDLFGSYSDRDGETAASHYSAAPGTSEHQTGLAIDVTGADGRCQASPCFGSTPAALWLAANAARFGFIVRYPSGKEAITGYQYEPWHIRYVGIGLAQAITASGLTMEEYALAHPPS
jgi:D-alanyl-D-alanine carboxypeptidase